MLSRLLDQLDDRRARRLRDRLGRDRWLVSWSPSRLARRSSWLARVSCPQFPLTVERRGRTRVDASNRARWALLRLLSTGERDRP